MKHVIAALVVLLAAPRSFADDTIGGISIEASQLGAAHPRAAASATRVAARTPRMPAVLASSVAPGKRDETERLYTALLSAFEQAMDKARMPRHDVAVSAALCVSSAYAAYHGGDVSDASFAVLVTQLRDALAATPAFANAPMETRQDMYEGLAITGGLLAVSAKGKPGSDSLRTTARTFLESFLHTSTDAIQLTDRGLAIVTSRARGDASPPSRSPESAPPPAPAPDAAPDAAPTGKPFPSSSIEALLWSFEMRYQAFPENGMVNVESSYLLLADGSCTERVPSTLDGYDPAKERAEHPKDKCKWRKDGSSYLVSTGGKFGAVPRVTVLRGARKGERLSGTWNRSKTSTLGTHSTWRGTTLVLGSDGRFDLATAGHWQSGSELNRREGEVVVSGTYDDRGTHATITGDHAGGSIKTSSGRGPADQSGTYVLDGFTIELHYDSGRVERRLFAISTDRDHVFVRFGGDIMPGKSK